MRLGAGFHRLGESLREGGARARVFWAAACGALALVVYLSNGWTIGSGDTLGARYLPASIVHEFDLDLDEFPDLWRDGLPYWAVRVGGRVYSAYPMMPGVLGVPVHLAAHLFGDADCAASLEVQEKVTASLLTAGSVGVMFLVLREVASGPVALALCLVYAFCTSTFSVSAQALWQHGPSQFFLSLALLVLFRGRRGGRVWPAGAALGMAVLCRPANLVPALFITTYVLASRRREALAYVLAALPFAAIYLAFCSLYGSIYGGYVHLRPPGGVRVGNVAVSLAGLLISPSRGLFVFSPVLVLSLYGLWRRVVVERERLWLALGGAVVVGVFLPAKVTYWWGGHSFGPRLLADLVPLFVLLLVPWARLAIAERRRWALAPFVLLATASFVFHWVGAFSVEPYKWNDNPEINTHACRLWDWRDSQLLSAFRKRPDVLAFDSAIRGVGVREADPRATYRWSRRLEARDRPVSASIPLSLKLNRLHQITIRWRSNASRAIVSVVADGRELARMDLGPTDGRYAERAMRFEVGGEHGHLPATMVINVEAGAVWLDTAVFRRLGKLRHFE